jgi:hypothetical protein
MSTCRYCKKRRKKMEENWINEWQYIYDEEEEEEKVMS